MDEGQAYGLDPYSCLQNFSRIVRPKPVSVARTKARHLQKDALSAAAKRTVARYGFKVRVPGTGAMYSTVAITSTWPTRARRHLPLA